MALEPRTISPERLQNVRDAISRTRQQREEAVARDRENVQRTLTTQYLNRDRSFGDVAADTGIQLLQGATDLGSAAYGIGNFLTAGTLERATGMGENFARTDAILEDAKSDQLRYEKMMAGEAFEEGLIDGAAAYLSSPGLLSDLLVRSAPSIIPGVGAGATAARAAGGRALERGATSAVAGTEAATAAGRAAAGATGVQIGGQSFTDAYNQAIEEGLDDNEALLRAYQTAGIVAPATTASMLIPGLGPAAIEGQAIARLFGGEGVSEGVRAGVGVGRNVAQATGREAAQETIQGTTEQAALNLASTERNIEDNLGQTAVISAIAGGAMGLGVGAVRAPSALRSELDSLRTESAERLGNPELGLSEIEKSDAQKQNLDTPAYLRRRERGFVPQGRDLLGGELQPEQATEEIEAAPAPRDFAAEARETGQGTLFEDAEQPAGLPRVEGDEALSGQELLAAEEAFQSREVPGLPVVEESGREALLPQVEESQDAPLDPAEKKAYNAFRRRIAQRGSVTVPEGQDLLGDPVRQPVLGRPAEGEQEAPAQPDSGQLDLLNTAPNALRSGTGESVTQIIDRTLGISRNQPGVTIREAVGLMERDSRRRGGSRRESEFLSTEDISAIKQQEAEQAYIADRFTPTERVDSAGDPIYTQYDRNLQAVVEVPYQQVQDEAKAFVRQRTAEPAELWKETLAQDLGLPQNTALRGKGWNSFAEAVNEAGVRPTDDTVASELVTLAERLSRQELPASKFMDRFLEKYGPGSDIARSFEPAPRKVSKKAKAKPSEQASGRNWKQYLAKTLGLKPGQMRGKAWDTFDQLVKDRGIRPGDEGTEAFLQEASEAIDAPPESAPAFAAALRTAYPVAEDVEITVPATQQEAAEGQPSEATQNLEGVEEAPPREIEGEVFESQAEAIQYFVTTFAEAADGLRSTVTSETGAKKEMAKLFGKMVNLVTTPADLPALVKAMYSQLQFRGFTPIQRRDALYKPVVRMAKKFMGDATTVEQLDAAYRPIDREVLNGNSGFPDRGDTGVLNELDADLANYYAERLDMLVEDPANPNNTSKFSRTGEGTASQADALSRDKVNRAVSRANALAQPGEKQITVYDTVADAEQALGIPMPKDANGVYFAGEAAIIRENITNTQQLADTMLHERTHGGLEGLLGGERLRAVNSRLWSNPSLRSRIKAKMDSHQLSRQDAAEEVLVDMLVGRETINKSIFSKLRAAINRTAEALVGQAGYTFSDADVNALLHDTADYMRGGRTYYEGPVGGYADKLAELEAAIRGDTVPASPKFSTAGIELDRATRTGEVGFDGMKKASAALGDAVRAAITDKTFKPFADLAPPSATRLSQHVMDFMPLRALARHYKGTMDAVKVSSGGEETRVDTLRKHADLSRQKDNNFNKELHELRDYEYAGPNKTSEKLRTSKQGVAEEWAKFRNSDATKARELDQMNNRATTYKLHPDRSWDAQSKLDYTKLPYTEAERREQFDKLRTNWEAVGDRGRAIYKKTQAIYNQTWVDRFKEIERAIVRESGLTRTMTDPDTGEQITNKQWVAKWRSLIDTAVAKLKQGPYSPLQRHGDYFVTVRDTNGAVLHFSAYDREADAMIARKNLLESRTDDSLQVQFTVRKNFDRAMDGMNRKVYENMQRALDSAFPGTDSVDAGSRGSAREALQAVYLQQLDDAHILKHGMKRKFVDGASLDTLRGYTSYALKASRSLASMRYDYQIEDNLRDMEQAIDPAASPQKVSTQTGVYEAVRRQHKAAIEYEYSRISDIMTQTGFVYWMTSPSQMALNASQTALVTVPRLAAKYNSVPGAMKAIGAATGKFLGTRRLRGMHDPEATTLDQNSAHFRVMRELFDRGVLDFTLSHDMSGLASGDSFGMNSKKRTALQYMSWFMHNSEVANREIATYAAVELEMQKRGLTSEGLAAMDPATQRKALDELTDVAEEFVDTTQFDYSQSNKPKNLQGPIARVVFQFQQFRINMLAMMATDIKRAMQRAETPEQKAEQREAWRALAYMTGTQLMMTGAMGSVLAPVAFLILDMFRDEDELLSSREAFAQSVPQWMSQGLLSFGVDTARFGFDTLIPFIGGTRYMPVQDATEDNLSWLITNSIGPWVGLGQNMARGVDAMGSGDYFDAFKQFAPKLISDSTGGVVEWWGGQPNMTRDDVPYYTPSAFERVLNIAGLKSGGQAEAQYDRNAVYSGLQRASNRKKSLLGSYHLAGDSSGMAEAMEAIRAFNQTNPEVAITRSSIRASATNRQRKISNATNPSVNTPISNTDTTLAQRLREGG